MDSHGNAFYNDLLNNEYSFDLSGEYSTQPSRSSQIRVEEESTQKKNTRAKKISVEEDMMLISAWLNISIDAVYGTEQKNHTYWKRVHSYYQQYKQFKSERIAKSLMYRWSSIQLAVGKFHGYFMQIEARQQSGINEHDKVIKKEKLRLKEIKEEERIMAIDTSNMHSLQADYYKALQMQIIAKRMQQ
ncbi:hypothetical protein QJS04_geneDACA001874 [Acorus gramineus]|uniref:No apical meristem-associated C-terminal domain-containing protein n=1 Tax=Acorus gramineus TaxID=55184 RepID=A0AAV9BK50_ACOGR|nr:hypothetical protein QJS04_geneDACA001874 [Acorus gramineus]